MNENKSAATRKVHRERAAKKAGFDTFEELVVKIKTLIEEKKYTQQRIKQETGVGYELLQSIIRENDIKLPSRKEVMEASIGVPNIMMLDEIRQRQKESVQEKWQNSRQEIIAKQNATNMERYGTKRPLQAKKIRDKMRKTMLVTHGVEYMAQVPGLASAQYHSVKEQHGGVHPMCLRPNGWKSRYEFEMIEFLESLGFEGCSDRKILEGKEIDVLVEKAGIGFEMSGAWAHSEENGKDRNFHFDKFQMAREKGIRLLTIWDFEWDKRRKQVENFIKSLMGVGVRVHARDCKFEKITREEASAFIEENHIQPILPRLISSAFALRKDGKLLSVMAFGRHHRGGDEVVLSRFCSLDGVNVVGGASKLLMNAAKTDGFETCISWSDNRWSWGNVYEKVGFREENHLPPDYFYVDMKNGKVRSKQSCNKKNLGASANQTEHERAKELGLSRVWDCGKVKWRWQKC